MDRRQLLLGATALGLATNLNLNHLLVAQVGKANVATRPSDRERAGLRGSVKTCSSFIDTETESMSEQEYAADGRLLVWRGRLFALAVSRASTPTMEPKKLIGSLTVAPALTDEFHYDEQGKRDQSPNGSPTTRSRGHAGDER